MDTIAFCVLMGVFLPIISLVFAVYQLGRIAAALEAKAETQPQEPEQER